MKKAYPYKYSEEQFATLGQSPGLRSGSSHGMQQDEELESTVFGQSPIHNANFNENTSRISDDQTYFGNMKANMNITDSFTGTGMKMNLGSNFNTISSSAESTPHKVFKAGLMAKMQNKGNQIITGQNLLSQESSISSYDGGLIKQSHHVNPPEAIINNKMDDDKVNFNPMSTHEQYDLSKYTNQNIGEEILINQNVEPIDEQSCEESRMGKSGNVTPLSSDPREAEQISSETATPYNYTTTGGKGRKMDQSPYAPLDHSAYSYGISMPKYGGKENEINNNYFEHSSNDNNFEEKTTNLTGYKSYIDKKSNNLSHNMNEKTTPEGNENAEDSSFANSHLYNKYQIQNLQFSQLSSSNTPYDGTASKLLPSSPTIEERGPESEEASNDSQLKIEQLNWSISKGSEGHINILEDAGQPKTGTIGQNTARLCGSSTLNFVSNLDSGTNYQDSAQRKSNSESEDDYKSHFKLFAERKYVKEIERDEIKPSSIFKNRSYMRDYNKLNYMVKRVDQDYSMLKKLKIASIYSPSQELKAVQIIENEENRLENS